MSDTFNMSGDFRGSVINVKSTLQNVQQTIGEMRGADQGDQEQLQKLVGQLSDELQNSPAASKEQVDALVAMVQQLVDQARAPQPNHTMVQITAEGLKQAAKNLAGVLPSVLPMAVQIADVVGKIISGAR